MKLFVASYKEKQSQTPRSVFASVVNNKEQFFEQYIGNVLFSEYYDEWNENPEINDITPTNDKLVYVSEFDLFFQINRIYFEDIKDIEEYICKNLYHKTDESTLPHFAIVPKCIFDINLECEDSNGHHNDIIIEDKKTKEDILDYFFNLYKEYLIDVNEQEYSSKKGIGSYFFGRYEGEEYKGETFYILKCDKIKTYSFNRIFKHESLDFDSYVKNLIKKEKLENYDVVDNKYFYG